MVRFIKHAVLLARGPACFDRVLGLVRAGTRRLALAIVSALLVSLSLPTGAPGTPAFGARAVAQDGAGSDWESGPSESRCSPRCRSGYECKHSECLPICSPSCGPGYLCTAGGSCVRTDGPPPPVSASQGWGASNNQCLPSCRSGYTCVSGQCVSLCNPICPAGEYCTEHGECVAGTEQTMSSEPAAQTAAPAKAEPAKPARSSSADSIVNLHMDVLGLLQFGPTPTLEIGKKFSGYLRIRPMNAGLMSYFLLAPDSGDSFKWGLGATLGMHVFSARDGNMRGVFGGPALEYAFVKTQNNHPDMATYGTHVLIPQLDMGYRWAFDSFLLGLSGRLGVSVPIASYDHPIGINGCALDTSCNGDRNVYVFGGIALDIGIFL
jgi:hypothetical protein